MVSDFPRILTLLRKEKKLSQKQAASDLGISQALLSHYEKGIRECGLSFVVRCADYYGVSCDYLLGRSANRQGQTITAETLPDASTGKDNLLGASVLPTLNKKLLYNSIHILYDFLEKYNNKSLTNEVSSYLSLSIYKMFRLLYSLNKKNPDCLFSVSEEQYIPVSNAALILSEAKLLALSGSKLPKGMEKIENPEAVSITTQSLSEQYPQAATSLLNLTKNAESRMKKTL